MIGATRALIEEARGWMLDCSWVEEPEELAEMTDQQVLHGVHHFYSGGLPQLARDTGLDQPWGIGA